MDDGGIDIAVVVERMSDNYFGDTNNPLYADILRTGTLI